MVKGLSLRFKLVLAFLAIVVVLIGVSAYQIRSIQHFNSSFLELVDTFFARTDALEEIKLLSVQMRDQTFEYQQEVFEGAPAEPAKQRAQINSLANAMKTQETKYGNLTSTDSADIQAIMTATDTVVRNSLAVIDATGVRPNQQAPESTEDQLSHAQDQLSTEIDKILASERKNASLADIEIDQTIAQLQDTVVILAASSTVLALGLGVGVSSWIARSLSQVKVGAQRIANGDFSHPIALRSNDEIGQLGHAFNSMAERLKEAYQRQTFAQQRDEAMLLSMGEGLIAVDADARVTLINKVASDLLGLPSEDAAIGRPIQDIYQLYPVNGSAAAQPLPTAERPSFLALHEGRALNDVFGLHKADGRKLLLNITANPIKSDEKVIGAITVLRDVTKEKEVDRMKTEFISLASHQLRTPLSAIKWFSEMLVSGDAGKLEPEQLDFATNIASSTERMIDLVNALLNISRIESGRIMVDPKPTDLKELVSGIVNDLKAKTEEKQQALIISVHDDLPKVNLDPRLIGQVYLNLLTNAVKYTPKGGEISVFISRKDDQIISQVTDNGYGIPKAQQDRVFQKFFRAANAVKVETDGTGLGLYLIKAIIESSGGKIWFESEEGKGTTFWFSMPMSGMKPKEGEVTLDV